MREHLLHRAGGQIVVAVNKEHILARGLFKPGITRGAETAVLCRDDRDQRRVTLTVRLRDCAGAVGRAVVDDDDLIAGGVFRDQRIQTFGKIGFDIVDGDHDAESAHGGPPYAFFFIRLFAPISIATARYRPDSRRRVSRWYLAGAFLK